MTWSSRHGGFIPCRCQVRISFSRPSTSIYRKVSGLAAWNMNANGRALCHQVQLYRYLVRQSSEFCRHNLCVGFQRVFVVVVVYFVIDSVRKLLNTLSYTHTHVTHTHTLTHWLTYIHTYIHTHTHTHSVGIISRGNKGTRKTRHTVLNTMTWSGTHSKGPLQGKTARFGARILNSLYAMSHLLSKNSLCF